MDSRYAIKRNRMRQRKLSTELENINARLEGSLYLIEHELNEVKKDQEKQSESEAEVDMSYIKRKIEFDDMDPLRRRASSFSTAESHKGHATIRKPNLHELKRDGVLKTPRIESPIAQYISSPIPHSYAQSRRMSLPLNILNSFEPCGGLHSSKGSGSAFNKGSNSSLKGSKSDVRRSRDSVTRSRDSSPEMEKYENQMRRLKRELNQRKPKTMKQLGKVPLTSTEESHIIRLIKEQERKKLNEQRNAELVDELKKCTYLRTSQPTELSVDEMLDISP